MDRVRSRDLVGVRLAVPRRFFCDNLSDGIDTAFEAGLHALESAGAVLVPFETSPAEQAYSIFVQGGLAGVEALVFIEEFLPERVNSLDPFVRWMRLSHRPWRFLRRLLANFSPSIHIGRAICLR